MGEEIVIKILWLLVVFCLTIAVILIWRDWKKFEKEYREEPKREKKSLSCYLGRHKWRYVSLPLRASTFSSYRPLRVFSTSYYNKKVSFHVKYCLKCLKFKAEKI